MNIGSQQEKIAGAAAEEILRLVYGDDLAGCRVSLDSISAVVAEAMRMDRQLLLGLLGAYESAMEALHRISVPPQADEVKTPSELHALLSERLDAVQEITRKVMALSAGTKTAAGETPT